VRRETSLAQDEDRRSVATDVDPLTVAKFTIPRQRQGLLERSRLLEVLEQGVAGPLTLVSAPAGTGKKVLLSAWATGRQAQGPVAWVTLELVDESRTGFWSSFVQGVARCGVVLPPPPAQTDWARDGAGYVDSMASALAGRAEPVVVVLHCEADISSPVADDLDHVLHRCGGMLRLVVATRVDPVLPLHRYRLAGALVEVRMADLAFTLDEARELMTSAGVQLSDTALLAIVDRTQGWAAGLRFAAVSFTQREDPERAALDFSGDTGNVAEYLIAEVLDVQPAGGRRLLLETSIIDVLRPGLSEAVAGPHAQRALAFLVRGNAFLNELPASSGYYRYHPLFRELLRAQLAYESPARVPELHKAAAAWLAEQGLVQEAVSHCAAAGDWEGAARHLIDGLAIGALVLPGNDALPGVLARMPENTQGAAASLVRAALAMAVFDVQTCEEQLQHAETELESEHSARWSAAEFALAMVRLIHSAAVANLERGLQASAAAERLLPMQVQERVARHPELAALIHARTGDVWLAAGQLSQAAEAFTAGAGAADHPGCEHLLINCLGQLAMLSAMRGRLRKASELSARAIVVQQQSLIAAAACPRAAEVAMAWLNTELYDLPAARRHAQRAAQSQAVGNDLTPRVMLALVDARLRRARGDVEGALAGIAAARSEAPLPPAWLMDLLCVEEADLRVANAQPALALQMVEGLDQAGGPEGVLVLARAKAATGGTFALPPTTLRGAAPSLSTRVGGLLLEATRQLEAGEQRQAAQALDHALRLAAPERLRRPFREAPPQVRGLLRGDPRLVLEHRWLGAGPQHDSRPVPAPRRGARSATEAHVTHVTYGAAPVTEVEDGRDEPAPSPILEPLTVKEREVLGHLAALLTTNEIAGVMFVSVNTVRTHVRNILRKLASSRRNEAVRRARDLGIIARLADDRAVQGL
jgi:LuxR family maltose regulon positive regulatory protein